MSLTKSPDEPSHKPTQAADETDPMTLWELQDPEEAARLERLFKRLDCVLDADLKHLRWEIEKHLENFRFFFDLALKAVALFYAIVGAILSIYFTKNPGGDTPVVQALLCAPLIIGVILGVSFLVGANYWEDATRKIRAVAAGLMLKVPDFKLLTILLRVFAASFFLSALGLLGLLLYISAR